MRKISTSHSFSIIDSDYRPNQRTNELGKRIHHRDPGVIDFICVDGEGINAPDHRYALFGVGSDQIVNEEGFHWREIFEFLYAHYKRGYAYTGFFLGYDFNQTLKTLPEERAKMLLTDEGRAKRRPKSRKNPTPFPVRFDGWDFDMLAGKRLKLRPSVCDHFKTCKCTKNPWMYVCDVGGFFQQSFMSVINPKSWIRPVVTPDEYALLEAGKKARADQVAVTEEMKMYNALENEILARVLRQLNQGFREIGVYLPPSKWFGPGQAAQTWMLNEELIRSEELFPMIPDWFLEAARASYFGGWFEIMMHGMIEWMQND